tara:strand:+ start:6545 stop:6868 length:324 start_codon:yes stop_codon:yes gene_type:complete
MIVFMDKSLSKRNKNFIKSATITILTVGFSLISIITIGAGHGTTIPSKIIFPYAYLALSNLKDLNIFVYILALIQIPIYGIIYYNKPKYMKWLFVMHIIATIFVLIN